MRLLGAILAGGRSARFGSDKAEARIGAASLIEHAASALALQVDDLVICGRSHPVLPSVADRPGPDLGPLGGLNAALHHAGSQGFAAVLTTAVDIYPVPADLAARLSGGGARFVAGQQSLGLWPVTLAAALDRHIAAGGRSIRSWIATSGAEAVTLDQPIHNINTAGDLARAVTGSTPSRS